MRWFLLSIGLLGALTGCGPEPEPFDPTKPHRYRVLRGDTWQSISSKREVEPEEVKRWNGLREDHKLIPGQILWVFPGGKNGPAPGEHPAVAAARINNPEAEPPTVKPLPRPSPSTTDGEDAVADADAPRTGSAPTKAPAAVPGSAPKAGEQTVDGGGFGPGGTSLLSLLDEVDEVELEHVPSVAKDGAPIDSVLAGRRGGLGGGGAVDGTNVEIDRVVKPEPGPKGPTTIPKLPKAEPKHCLAATLDDDIGEYDMAGAAGLSKGAIKTGMRPVRYAIQGCLPPGGGGPHEVHVEVSIGCDGLVYDTRIVKDAGLPEPVTACVTAVTDQASFAAAAGATTFLYPLVLGY